MSLTAALTFIFLLLSHYEILYTGVQKKTSQNGAMNWYSILLLKNSIKYNETFMLHPFDTFLFDYAIENNHIFDLFKF